MKNIHVLKTSKPSKLLKDLVDKTYQFKKEVSFGNRIELPLNIYITSDEETLSNNGDYYLGYPNYNTIHKWNMEGMHENKQVWIKKIILTTDQDLIKDGVQAIDDTFLKWFVNNPSCENVSVQKRYSDFTVEPFVGYKIIIPKEESKQYPIGGYAPGYYSCTCVTCKKEFTGDKRAVQCEPCAIEMTRKESKQETLEKALNSEIKLVHDVVRNKDFDLGFQTGGIFGAKWQADRMYSEEEVLKAQQSILCNIKDALMNKNYIIEYLNNLKTNKI